MSAQIIILQCYRRRRRVERAAVLAVFVAVAVVLYPRVDRSTDGALFVGDPDLPTIASAIHAVVLHQMPNTIILAAGATYNEAIEVSCGTVVTIDGNGATLVVPEHAKAVFSVDSCEVPR